MTSRTVTLTSAEYDRLAEHVNELRTEVERTGIDMRAWRQRAETAEAEVERLKEVNGAARRALAAIQALAMLTTERCESCAGILRDAGWASARLSGD